MKFSASSTLRSAQRGSKCDGVRGTPSISFHTDAHAPGKRTSLRASVTTAWGLDTPGQNRRTHKVKSMQQSAEERSNADAT